MPLTGAKRFQVRGEGGREAVATPVGCGFLAAASWCCDCSPTTVDAPRRAWEHPEAGRALGLAGREWVRSRYSAERLVEDLASCTRSCWSGGSPEVGTEVPRFRGRLLEGLPWPWEQRPDPIAAPSNLPSARGG